ncbi:ras guanine nucleotide exchange factor domain-containing protein [Podospora fimiseda]|uniref:Ras guanine nucleotide exchange factor domain-containing protein n=1 Tax=Podospora fimiseda TaxID=252190 RepID=A0AAN7BRZ5_9PEZI|nr:ras guanine nucleotide exchange factor domain-containing protein [Podospora fimiseda]
MTAQAHQPIQPDRGGIPVNRRQHLASAPSFATPPPQDPYRLDRHPQPSTDELSPTPGLGLGGPPFFSAPFGSEGTFLLPPDDSPAEHNNRDSFSSILNDPFFVRVASTTATTPTVTDRNDERQPSWIPPRKDSLKNDLGPRPWLNHRRNKTMESINIAIIGAEGVGKSTFVSRSIGTSSAKNVTVIRYDLDGSQYHVTLVELDLEGIELDPRQPVQWPKQIGGHMLPRMDGALILYDVTDEETIRELEIIMAALANSSLPTVLAATKCDTRAEERQLDIATVASKFRAAGHYEIDSTASVRACLQAMLRIALATRRGEQDKPEGSMQRRRAASAANLDAPQELINGRPISQHSKHSRASSDLSLLRGVPPPSGNDGSYYRGPASRSPRADYQPAAHHSNTNLSEDAIVPHQTVSSLLRTPGIRLDGAESFLDVSESDGESYRYSEDVPILQRSDESFLDRPSRTPGLRFDELVDRLIAPKLNKADHNFADIFLCLYRKFAAPNQLLTAIHNRLDQMRDDRTVQYLLKVEAQARTVEAVAKWVSLYPGDFARPATRRSLEEFIRQLSTEPMFVAAANQMRLHLEQNVTEDDDTGWEKSDPLDDGDVFDRLGKRRSILAGSVSSLMLDDPSAPASQRRPSQSSEMSGPDTHTSRMYTRQQYHSFEDYEREASTLIPIPRIPMDKQCYQMFMNADADAIAEEITRMDWVMFSSIRIRDLVRHVSLSQEQKEKCRGLKNVNRMVSHFNHIAKWVANMVLIRDKAKHRAPCLEKFMVIAQKLRLLNNYNGLAAVLAGINGTAIHRLSQTRALVKDDVQKRFARLGLLMSTQKSHFAYRLAWENSPLPRIPFVPLHRRDLVSAEEGSKTFVGPNGDQINWKKFEVLGEVLLPLMKSQGQPYPNLHRHELNKGLILNCQLTTDEEDIYQRSVQVEPSTLGGGSESSTRKKFAWLAK